MKNFIVGDAGGTSTDWRIVIDGRIEQVKTVGFNRYTHKISDFASEIERSISSDFRAVENTFLYIAGVETSAHKEEIIKGLSGVFKSEPVIENDLMGVSRSLCEEKEGMIGILGTGSNACYFNGKSVDKVSASMGYILGDEGSGADLGKRLLKKIFRNQLDTGLIDLFQNQYQLTSQGLIETLYNRPHPNQYLASFASFIGANKSHPDVYQIIAESFRSYFAAFFPNGTDLDMNFAGSVAYYFSDNLREVASDLGYSINKIVEGPIAGLVLYHQNND